MLYTFYVRYSILMYCNGLPCVRINDDYDVCFNNIFLCFCFAFMFRVLWFFRYLYSLLSLFLWWVHVSGQTWPLLSFGFTIRLYAWWWLQTKTKASALGSTLRTIRSHSRTWHRQQRPPSQRWCMPADRSAPGRQGRRPTGHTTNQPTGREQLITPR